MIIKVALNAWGAVSPPGRQAMLKAAVTIVVGGWIAMSLLDLRFAQQAARHEQGRVFRELDGARKSLWSAQAEIGRHTHPLQLMDRLNIYSVPTLPVVESDEASGEVAAEVVLIGHSLEEGGL
ncbi:MAG: hypothetical protein RIG82_12990 [Phycisphaeraceae bacterium]